MTSEEWEAQGLKKLQDVKDRYDLLPKATALDHFLFSIKAVVWGEAVYIVLHFAIKYW